MKHRMMDILVCPHCGRRLKLNVFEEEKDDAARGLGKKYRTEIKSGLLTCSCRRWYPIINGIPRMLPDSLRDKHVKEFYNTFLKRFKNRLPKGVRTNTVSQDSALKEKTLKSFGFQWNRFSKIIPEFRANFLNYIKPIKPSFFRNKLVLDAGCGFGRHTYYSAEFGAEVVGMDLSNAVDAAYKNLRKFPKAHVVQGDIYNLPFRSRFDFIFSIGVIHHLPDPEKGYLSLVKFAKKGTPIFIWVYGREGRWFKVNVVGRLRKITRHIPHRILYVSCYIPAAVYQVSNDIYIFLNRGCTKPLARFMPFKGYAKFPFMVKHADAFDLLATPEDNYYTRQDMEQWVKNARLKNTWITDIDGRSWRVFGEKWL